MEFSRIPKAVVVALIAILGCSSESRHLQSYYSSSGYARNVHGFGEVVKVGAGRSVGERSYYLAPVVQLDVGQKSQIHVSIGPRDHTCGFWLFISCRAMADGRTYACGSADGSLEAWMLRHDATVWPVPTALDNLGKPLVEPRMHRPSVNLFIVAPEKRSELACLIPLLGHAELTVSADLEEYRIEMKLKSPIPVSPDFVWLENREEICRAEIMLRGRLIDPTEMQELRVLRERAKDLEPAHIDIDMRLGKRLGPRIMPR
jgi:hypothetical protein